jgi:beta-galactosidase
MNKRSGYVLMYSLVFLLTSRCTLFDTPVGKQNRTFDLGWKFIREDVPGAEKPDFNDSRWRDVDLPHDWSIEDLPGPDNVGQIGPFSKTSPGGTSTGYVVGGTGWYRKTFTIDPADQGKDFQILFDGVYMESDVYINGQHIGFHPYGYTPFYYDLTPYVNTGEGQNVVAVRVNNPGRNSRWYSGSGIYRHVWLVVTDPVHVPVWGVAVTTPEITDKSATVQVDISLENKSGTKQDIKVHTEIVRTERRAFASAETNVTIDKQGRVSQTLQIHQPALWTPEQPNLYQARIELYRDGKILDCTTTTFGIRSMEFSARDGFILNGMSTLLRGGCVHHDNGLLGSATFDRAEERRIQIMKAAGFNAIRTSHNPPSAQFLDACDRVGMMVIDEAFDMWEVAKNPDDYHRYFKEWHEQDLKAMLLRDRNHPSVIIWSIGNEVSERADTSGVRIAKNLVHIVKQMDKTRPVTAAICSFWDHPGMEWNDTEPAFSQLDIGGYNYQWQQYETDHEKFPNRIMMGTESVAREALENWQEVEKHPWVIGDFVWTGMDYLGETGIGHTFYVNDKDVFAKEWPWYNAWCGDLDICGFKKPQALFRSVVWGWSPLEIAVHRPLPKGRSEGTSYWGWPDELPSWTWPGKEGEILQVSVSSRCTSVRLELNGRVIGEKSVSEATRLTATFDVPYEPGELKAIGLLDGTDVTDKVIKTAFKPGHLRLTPDRQEIHPDRNDLCYITVEIVDDAGTLMPNVDEPVTFTLSGNGELAATGNAAPNDMKSFRQSTVNFFNGRCMAILRPFARIGFITLKASSPGMKSESVSIRVN